VTFVHQFDGSNKGKASRTQSIEKVSKYGIKALPFSSRPFMVSLSFEVLFLSIC